MHVLTVCGCVHARRHSTCQHQPAAATRPAGVARPGCSGAAARPDASGVPHHSALRGIHAVPAIRCQEVRSQMLSKTSVMETALPFCRAENKTLGQYGALHTDPVRLLFPWMRAAQATYAATAATRMSVSITACGPDCGDACCTGNMRNRVLAA